MKKIIIISYYSKPANFVGAERIKGWLSHLSKNGVYPVLVTRFWKENQLDNGHFNLPQENQIEKNKNYEIHRIASSESFRDFLIRKNKYKYLRKILSFFQILANNLFFKKSEYYPFYYYTDQFIKKNEGFSTVIVSGTPFHSFSVGYHIKKKHPNINWHPDYRDQWTTHPFNSKSKFIEKLIYQLESKKELKWTSNCSSFITVSDHWKDRIKAKIKKPGFVVKNGFNTSLKNITEQNVPRKKGELIISYVGSIYPYQDFEKLLRIVDYLNKTKYIKIKINFIGIDAYHKMSTKIEQLSKNFSELIHISNRVPGDQLESIYSKSDLLWLTSFGEMKGWYPVKLFEYASKGIPILLFPSDNDVMEKFVNKTQTGYVFNDESRLQNWLESVYTCKYQIKLTLNRGELKHYTREYQCEQLIDVLDSQN